ncbi:hypothetical protein [uncultured Ruminococcus sp.]|uniref:hypothetical protein n=1 Tax=uncultured Ruminococcus sp. TaxID=165186 RepID=UPI00260688D2|nr:hypothetical protein [uncultured Ruminococcus sp.]
MIQSKKWKCLVSGVIAVGFVAVGSLQYTDYVLAAEEAGNAEIAYVDDALSAYLSDTQYASMEDVSLSDAIPFYNFEDGTEYACEYITYYGDDVIGLLYLEQIEGNFYSSFRSGDFTVVQEAYEDGDEVALGRYNDETLIYDGSSFYGVDSSEVVNANEIETSNISLNSLDQTHDNIANSFSSTGLSASCPVEVVPNVSINGGLCWAAAIAAKYNYMNGLYEGDGGYVDAVDVNQTVINATGASSTVPLGYPVYIKQGLRCYGLLDSYVGSSHSSISDVTATRATMTTTELFTELYWDNPVLITMSGSGGKHLMIISGVSCGTGNTAIYTVVDSNFPEPVEVLYNNATSSTGDGFVYAAEGTPQYSAYGNKSFTRWCDTYSYVFAPGT